MFVSKNKFWARRKLYGWKKFLGQTIFLGWKLLVLKIFESKNIRTFDNAWGSGFLNFWKLSLIFYLNFCQFKGGMVLFFSSNFWCSRLYFLNFSNILQKYVTQGLKIDHVYMHTYIVKFDLFCKILFFWYTFDPKVPTYRTF